MRTRALEVAAIGAELRQQVLGPSHEPWQVGRLVSGLFGERGCRVEIVRSDTRERQQRSSTLRARRHRGHQLLENRPRPVEIARREVLLGRRDRARPPRFLGDGGCQPEGVLQQDRRRFRRPGAGSGRGGVLERQRDLAIGCLGAEREVVGPRLRIRDDVREQPMQLAASRRFGLGVHRGREQRMREAHALTRRLDDAGAPRGVQVAEQEIGQDRLDLRQCRRRQRRDDEQRIAPGYRADRCAGRSPSRGPE